MSDDLPDLNEPETEEIGEEATSSEESETNTEVGDLESAESEDAGEQLAEGEDTEEESEEELPSQYHRSSFGEIKAKYPTIFKEFPDLREAFFREREFTNLFPTVEDAQEAFNQAEAFQAIEKDLKSGSVSSLITALDQVDRGATVKVAENFLPQIYQRSPDLYYHIVSPILESFVKNVYEEGEKTGNDNYKAAAAWVAQFAWPGKKIEQLGQKKNGSDPEIEKERQRLQQEREALEAQKFNEVRTQVGNRAQKLLINEIVKEVAKTSFDSEYVKNNVVRDIFAELNDALTKDTNHMKLMHSLWAKAQKNGFSPEDRNRLVSTFLARAKRILPAVRKETLAQLNKSVKTETQQKQKQDAGGKVQKEAPAQNTSNKSGKVDWSNYKSGSDFLTAFVENKGKVKRV